MFVNFKQLVCSFTIIGHHFFERLVHNKFIEPFLDGGISMELDQQFQSTTEHVIAVAASVVGLLMLTAFNFMKVCLLSVVHT